MSRSRSFRDFDSAILFFLDMPRGSFFQNSAIFWHRDRGVVRGGAVGAGLASALPFSILVLAGNAGQARGLPRRVLVISRRARAARIRELFVFLSARAKPSLRAWRARAIRTRPGLSRLAGLALGIALSVCLGTVSAWIAGRRAIFFLRGRILLALLARALARLVLVAPRSTRVAPRRSGIIYDPSCWASLARDLTPGNILEFSGGTF